MSSLESPSRILGHPTHVTLYYRYRAQLIGETSSLFESQDPDPKLLGTLPLGNVTGAHAGWTKRPLAAC